jgi:hypothetical protein
MSNRKNLSIVSFIVISLFLVSCVSADLYVKPAKQGIIRLELYPFFPATLARSFELKNLYNFTIDIGVKPTDNFLNLLEVPVQNFSLAPNESRMVQYTISVKEPGNYFGGLIISANAPGKTSNVVYQSDLTIIVTKHNIILEIFLGIIVLAILVPIVYLAYKKKMFKKIKIKKRYLTLIFVIAFGFLFLSTVQAAKVAMIVQSSTSLSDMHEKKIYQTLQNMKYTVTLVDKYTQINYNNYDLIVVAGRPASEGLDSFVANLPVNEIPTVAVDYYYPDKWGWVEPDGRSTLISSQPQSVYIKEQHPLTEGFALNQKVYVHLIQGKTIVDLIKGSTNLTFVATANTKGTQGAIAYALPNTPLTNGKSVGNHAAVVFFGVTYPYYWTDDTVQLFENAVNWLANLDFNPPTTPVLTAPASSRTTTVKWQWTASNHSSGIKNYQFQISNSPKFNTTLVDITTSALNYTANNLIDGKTYYARVRALNYLEVYSEWSNTTKTIVDLSDIFVAINSPTTNTSVKVGDSIFVNATVQATRSITSCAASIADQTTNLTYDSNTTFCSGNFIISNVSSGLTNLTVSAANYLGTTNSSNVLIDIQSAPAQTSSGTTGGGGSDWSSSYLPALWLDANDIKAYENTVSTFTVKVRNVGTIAVHDVKVLLTGTDLTYDVEPNLIDLSSGSSQEYKITLQIPDNSAGKYEITIKAIGYETYKAKKITLTVLPKILIPVLQAVSIELPTFYENESTSTNITIQNMGNLTTIATTYLTLPDNWTAENSSQSLEIKPGEQQKFSFIVTPSNVSGEIKFDVKYLADGQEKYLSESTSTTVNSRSEPEEEQPQPITGMIISTLLLPQVYVPSTAGVVLLVIFLFRKNILKTKGISKIFFSHRESVLATTPKRKINPASSYSRWERRYAKR